MASNQTPNYGLSQWERTDQVRMEDFNADNAKLDTALAAQAGALGDKADVTALEALARTVSTLSGTVSGQASTLSKKGNCQLYATSYVGNGRYGSGKANSLSFPAEPLVVMVFNVNGFPLIMMRPCGFGTVDGWSVNVSWGTRGISWYSTMGESVQLNQDATTYHAVALLALE